MKFKLFFLALFSVFIVNAQQPFSKSSIEPEFGITKIQDVTPFNTFNAGIGYRYMFNTKFGANIKGNYTDLNDSDYPMQYTLGTLHGVVNIGRLLEFESFTKRYTILLGIGGTYTYSENQDNIYHRYSNFHLSSTINNEFKLSKTIFLNAKLDFIKDVNNRPFVPISTETTNIFNINVGLTINLNNKKEHADWYLETPVTRVDTLFTKPTIIDMTKTINKYIPIPLVNDYEVVLFEHDSDVVSQGLENIEKHVKRAGEVIVLTAYCSNIGSVEYNKDLAMRRGETVEHIIRELGYKGDVKIIASGIRDDYSKDIHNLARCVIIQ